MVCSPERMFDPQQWTLCVSVRSGLLPVKTWSTLSQLPCCQLSPRALPCFSPCLQCTGRMRRRWDNEELVAIVIEILPCQVSLSRAFAQSHSNEADATIELWLKSLSNYLVLVRSISPFLHQLCQKWAFLSLNFCCLGSFAHFLWSRAAC